MLGAISGCPGAVDCSDGKWPVRGGAGRLFPCRLAYGREIMPGTRLSWRARTSVRARLAGAVAAAGLAGLAAAAMTGAAPAASAATVSAASAVSAMSAVTGSAVTGSTVTGSTVTASADTASGGAARVTSGPAAASQAPVPSVPASASFVAQPRIAAGQPGVHQACGTPTRPGQMACMALVSTRKTDGVRADTSPPGGSSYDPAELQDAYGLTTAAGTAANGETRSRSRRLQRRGGGRESRRLPVRLRPRHMRSEQQVPDGRERAWRDVRSAEVGFQRRLGARGIARPRYGLGDLP